MNMPNMKGGFTVTGLVTGGHMIHDIQVNVPHQVAIFIPAEKAYRSKDLWRGIQQQKLFQLTGGSGLAIEPREPTETPNDSKILELKAENKALRKELGEAQRQKTALQESVESMQQQLQSILRAIGKIDEKMETASVPQAVPSVAASVVPITEAINEAVGGDVPTFIPDDLKPEDAKSHVVVKAEVSSTSVSDAAKALRKIKRKG